MFDQIVFWHWFAFAALLLVLEIMAPGVVFLWLGIAAALTGILALIFPFSGLEIQGLFFAIVSVATVWIGRRFWRPRAGDTDHPRLNRRGSEFIGHSYVLEETPSGGTGHVRIGDTVWPVRITGEDLPLAKGDKVRIVEVSGAVLDAEPLKSYEARSRGSA